MPRLTSVQQLTDYQNKEQVATFDLTKITTNPKVLAAYARLIEAYEASGYLVQKSDYRADDITVYYVKSPAELSKILADSQKEFDENKRHYDEAKVFDDTGVDTHGVEEWASYKKSGVRYFAERENWIIPELVTKEASDAWEAAKKASGG